MLARKPGRQSFSEFVRILSKYSLVGARKYYEPNLDMNNAQTSISEVRAVVFKRDSFSSKAPGGITYASIRIDAVISK